MWKVLILAMLASSCQCLPTLHRVRRYYIYGRDPEVARLDPLRMIRPLSAKVPPGQNTNWSVRDQNIEDSLAALNDLNLSQQQQTGQLNQAEDEILIPEQQQNQESLLTLGQQQQAQNQFYNDRNENIEGSLAALANNNAFQREEFVPAYPDNLGQQQAEFARENSFQRPQTFPVYTGDLPQLQEEPNFQGPLILPDYPGELPQLEEEIYQQEAVNGRPQILPLYIGQEPQLQLGNQQLPPFPGDQEELESMFGPETDAADAENGMSVMQNVGVGQQEVSRYTETPSFLDRSQTFFRNTGQKIKHKVNKIGHKIEHGADKVRSFFVNLG